VKMLLGITASDFRSVYDGSGMFQKFRQELVLPYITILRDLHPLAVPPGWIRGSRLVRKVRKQPN
jgi:hypothetical protein